MAVINGIGYNTHDTAGSASSDPYNKNNYTYAANGSGGVNYFFNGQPITNTVYARSTGQDTGAIEKAAKSAYSAAKNTSTPAPNNSNGTSGSSSGTTYEDKSNDIAAQNAGLSAVDTQTQSGLSQIASSLAKILGGYDTEATANEGNYTTQSNTNQNNYQTNKQTALVNAASGRQGLFGTLASLGALNGSGLDLATKAVQKGANQDLSSANGNYTGNQTTLDTAIGTFRAADKARRDDAQSAADQSNRQIQNDALKSKQSFYTNLANDYAAEGNSGQSKAYTSKAAALYPQIATSAPVTPLVAQTAAYTPSTLSSYLSGTNSTSVASTPSAGTTAGTLVATNKKKVATV